MDVAERLAPILHAARIFFNSVSPPVIGDGPVKRGSIDVDSGMLCGFTVRIRSNASCLVEAVKYLSLEIICRGLLISRNTVTQEALHLVELLEDDDKVRIPHRPQNKTDSEPVTRVFTFPSCIFRQLYGTDSGYTVNHTVNYVLECFSGDEILDVTTETRPFAENKTE